MLHFFIASPSLVSNGRPEGLRLETAAVRPREAGSILKLVNLALTRMPSMFGGENRGALSEVLERVLPMFCRPQLADISHELVAVSLRILTILSQVDTGLFQSVVKGFVELFEGSSGNSSPSLHGTVPCFLLPTVPAQLQFQFLPRMIPRLVHE